MPWERTLTFLNCKAALSDLEVENWFLFVKDGAVVMARAKTVLPFQGDGLISGSLLK